MSHFEGHPPKRARMDNDGGRPFNNFNNRNSGGKPGFEEKPNHILLMTVINPAYPITTDVIHTICNPSGKVSRIVIFKKNGVQAMVEFDSIEAAERAKQSLNGCDIYSGCCTLKIEFAKPQRLNVYKNDNESWDYTNNQLSKPPGGERPALLQQPPRGYGPPEGRTPAPYEDTYDDGYMPRGPRPDPYGHPPMRDPYAGPVPPGRRGHESFSPGHGPMYGPGGPMHGGNQPGTVLMAYNLNHQKMNPDKLFNIICLYGNVIRIKFLKSKEGCAMIQMSDPLAVERTISNLQGVSVFGSNLQLNHSKQAVINEVQQPFPLPDGTPSFKDFSNSRSNRFSNPEVASKNRITPACKLLHFYNAPVGFPEEDMKKIFEDKGVKPPINVKLFQSKKETERCSTGLLEFNSTTEALEALATCNHVSIPNPGSKFPYTLKLCFSSSGPGARGGPPRGGHY